MTTDGGYAEFIIAEARGIGAVPQDLDAVAAAPLLCVGHSTFDMLHNSNPRAGDLVAVHRICAMGHIGLTFARTASFHTVTMASGGAMGHVLSVLTNHGHMTAPGSSGKPLAVKLPRRLLGSETIGGEAV